MKKFMYKLQGVFYANGPVEAKDEKDARAQIRAALHVLTLRGVEVWRTQ